jgi:hypothetical protein
MDGSKACFAVRLNSGLTKKLHGYNILLGASFTVKYYYMILPSHDSKEPLLNQMVMFVKDFEWQTPPSANHLRYPDMATSDKWTHDTFQKANFNFDLVRDVKQTKVRLNVQMDLEQEQEPVELFYAPRDWSKAWLLDLAN